MRETDSAVIPFRSNGEVSLIERHAQLLAPYEIRNTPRGQPCPWVDKDTKLIPLGELPGVIAQLEQSLRPATRQDVKKAVMALFGSFKVAGVVLDPDAFTAAMNAELAEFPVDVLQDAVRHARRTLKWLPSIAEMIEICKEVGFPRRDQLNIAKQMEREHRRRAELAAEREERARKNAELEARMPEYWVAVEAELRARNMPPEQVDMKMQDLRMFPGVEFWQLVRAWEERNQDAA
jgi:hypothetical protein